MKSDSVNKQNRSASSGEASGRKNVMEAIIGQVKAAQEDDENVRNAVTVYEQIRENRALEHELTQSYIDVNDDQEKTDTCTCYLAVPYYRNSMSGHRY